MRSSKRSNASRKSSRFTVHKLTRKYDFFAQEREVRAVLREYVRSFNHHPVLPVAEIRAMATYIHTHLFKQSLSAEVVKKACMVRNNNVTKRFRQAFGKGIWEYIVTRRLEASAFVLSSRQVNIYILAAAIGYTEEAFSKAFKNAYGCSPMQYHKDHYEKNVQERSGEHDNLCAGVEQQP